MNKFNIPVIKYSSIFEIPLNCIDHYNLLDGSKIYRRTLNRYNITGIIIRKKIKIPDNFRDSFL